MPEFRFVAERAPFPRWMGPFCPARGNYSGFRFHGGRIGTWVENSAGREFWRAQASVATSELERLVLSHWGGGRVLFLVSGPVIKPLQHDAEVGQRVLIGRFEGDLPLIRPDGTSFNLGSVRIAPGEVWAGPKTTGLECVIQADGSLECQWYHPSKHGRESVVESLTPPDPALLAGFRRARPGDPAGRVRVTANGHVITNRLNFGGSWGSYYVGKVQRESFLNRDVWIERRS